MFCHRTKHSCGTLVLSHPLLDVDVEHVEFGKRDRQIILCAKIDDYRFTFINVYAPKDIKTQVEFFESLKLRIAGLQVTSRRPCWWSRTKASLSAGKWTLFWCKISRRISFVLTTNMAALSRGCNPRIRKFADENIMIGGDLNCWITPKDKRGGRPSEKKKQLIDSIFSLVNSFNLVDVWRKFHPNESLFT